MPEDREDIAIQASPFGSGVRHIAESAVPIYPKTAPRCGQGMPVSAPAGKPVA